MQAIQFMVKIKNIHLHVVGTGLCEGLEELIQIGLSSTSRFMVLLKKTLLFIQFSKNAGWEWQLGQDVKATIRFMPIRGNQALCFIGTACDNYKESISLN